MDQITFQDVADNLALHCVLCGELVGIHDLEEHAATHDAAGECWTYAAFEGACNLDADLVGWPLVAADGREAVWPFWLCTEQLEAVAFAKQLAGVA